MSFRYAAWVVLTVLLLCGAWLLRGPEMPSSPPDPLGPHLRILAIGDSITEGMPLHHPDHAVDRMGEALGGLDYRVTIINRGVGATSAADWSSDKGGMLTKAIEAGKASGFQSDDIAWI